MTVSKKVIRMDRQQKGQASEVLARAFHLDPIYRRIFHDVDGRSRYLPKLFSTVIGYTLAYGHVYTTRPVEGVACWLSPGNAEVTLWRMIRTGMEFQRTFYRFPSDARQQLLNALAHMHETHRHLMKGPHWYLWALGVAPEYQGRGLGGQLIRPVLRQSERDGIPCYLETQNEKSVDFYRKWGFKLKSLGVIPDLDIKVWSMTRSP